MKRIFLLIIASAIVANSSAFAQKYTYEEHSERMYQQAGQKYRIDTIDPDRMDVWRSAFRAELKDKLGLSLIGKQLKGYKPEAWKVKEDDMGFARREWWVITTEPDIELPFIVLIPKDFKGVAPLMITPHGHSKNPELSAGVCYDDEDRTSIEEGDRDVAVQAVQHGFVTIAPTARGFGPTRFQKDMDEGNKSSCRDLYCRDAIAGRTPVGDRVWDIMKLIDWAYENLPVDRKNVIVSGNSGGGTATLYAGAIDTRISISVPSCAFCLFSPSIGHRKHCECNYVPGVMTLSDMGEIGGLTAPRAFCTINGIEDKIFPIQGARDAFAITKRIYEMSGVPDNCGMYEGQGGHRYYKDGAWDFIMSHLDGVKAHDVSRDLPKWQEGMLDLHFISTGSGNSAYIIMPDGTTMLVDAGDLRRPDSRAPARRPDETRSVGQWIVDYIKQFAPEKKQLKLDYAIVTHFHDDHIGCVANANGYVNGYPLSGITEVCTSIPVGKFIDRGYTFPIDFDKDTVKTAVMMRNVLKGYRDFIDYQCKHNGMSYEEAEVGSSEQIRMLKHQRRYPDFKVRVLFANGRIADTVEAKVAKQIYKKGANPSENNLSVGFRIDYGKFNFYSGGDIAGVDHIGATLKGSMESEAAPVIGAVDVASLNHHGNRDTQNAEYVATLKPRVWIGQSWGIRHPGEEVIRRLSSKYVYPDERDIYATYMAPENKKFMNLYTQPYKSTSGHILVRVAPGGESYDVFVLDDTTAERQVLLTNHYESK